MNAVFLDRDGTVTVGIPTYERIDSLSKVELLPKSLEALTLLAKLDFAIFFVTNQAGLAEGRISQSGFDTINNRVLELIAPSEINILKTYACPHAEQADCACRKPKPKMLYDAAKEYNINLAQSWMIGDRSSDILTGIHAGCRSILVLTGIPTERSDQATYIAPTLLEAVQYIAGLQTMS